MSLFPPGRFAVYKSFPLGDIVKGPETLTLDGDPPTRDGVMYGDRSVMSDHGASSIYVVDLKAILKRGYFGVESAEDFYVRRFGLVQNMRRARGYWPASNVDSTAGVLAVAEDASKIIQSSGAVSASGSPVNIPCTPGVTVLANERWLIFDPNNHESFIANAGVTTPLQAQALVNSYASGAFIFRVSWALPAAFLLPGIKLEGDADGASGVTKEIGFTFWSTDDILYGPHS